jgi:serine/threonine-protein kinase
MPAIRADAQECQKEGCDNCSGPARSAQAFRLGFGKVVGDGLMASGSGFLHELRRRHVFRVAVAYAVVGWLLIQFATQVFPVFNLPAWAAQLVVLLILLGFPVALVLAWAFEMTPEGVRRTEPVHSPEATSSEQRRHVGRKLDFAIIGVLVLAVVALLWRQMHEHAAPAAAAHSASASAKSVAVLPFENLSTEKENEYFASGMQDEILTRLANIHDLKVISRTSTQKYASRPENLKVVAAELGVAALLEGSVQRAGSAVHINLQLINAQDDAHLWAESYDREVKDIFGVERDVATKVADALKAQLLPQEAEHVASVPTQNPEAYDLYLRALAFSNRANDQYALTKTVMPQAADLLQQALAKDPAFALAAALLGRAHMYMYFFGGDRTDARLAAAKAAADQALALRPELGEAHFALAFYWYWGFREYTRATTELDLARTAMPRSVDIQSLTAAIARRQGKWEQALDDLRQAAIYDPRNASIPFEFGQTYATLRRYAEADQAYGHAAELSADPGLSVVRRAWNTVNWKGDLAPMRAALNALPAGSDARFVDYGYFFALAWLSRDFAAAASIAEASPAETWTAANGNSVLSRRLWLGWAYAARGDPAKASALYADLHTQQQAAVRERPNDWDRHMALAFAAAGLGAKDEAIAEGRRATELLPVSRDAFAGPEMQSHLAKLYVRVGENDQAIAVLQQLMAWPAGLFVSPAMLRLDPVWDPLRGDPRFQTLLKEPEAPHG